MKRGAKTRNSGLWTEAKYWSVVRSTLRRTFRWWKPAQTALNNARKPYKGPNKRAKWLYTCAGCGKDYLRKDTELHHIQPVGALSKPEDLAGFIERLTPEQPEAYSVLCKKCHKKKTDEQRKK